MTAWGYLIVAHPVTILNREGAEGWEAVGMKALGDGSVAVLLKRAAEFDVAERHDF